MKSACPTGKSTSPRLSETVFIEPCGIPRPQNVEYRRKPTGTAWYRFVPGAGDWRFRSQSAGGSILIWFNIHVPKRCKTYHQVTQSRVANTPKGTTSRFQPRNAPQSPRSSRTCGFIPADTGCNATFRFSNHLLLRVSRYWQIADSNIIYIRLLLV